MTIRVRFRREAEADVLDALAWYRERGLELGKEFLRSLDSCIATIQRLPESRPVVYRDIRRALMSRFPYGIFYVREGDVIICIGLLPRKT